MMDSPDAIPSPPTVNATTEVFSPRVGHRSYFSTHFLAAAEDAAERATEHEQRVAEDKPRFSLTHKGDVVSTIMLSAAFVEAAINEVLQDAADGHDSAKLDGVAPDVRKAWAGLWIALDSGSIGRILDRYEAALVMADTVFDKGTEPWQSVYLVVRLRNYLVHYKPETVFEDDPDKLVEQLRQRVSQNPLSTNAGDVDGWLSADCARWAVNSALAFVEEFADKTGAQPNYQLTLDDLRVNNP